jgi:high-affinity nickel permease
VQLAHVPARVSVRIGLWYGDGGIETLGLVADELGLEGGICNFGTLGYAVIAIFVASWLISLVIYRVMGYDKLNALGASGKA